MASANGCPFRPSFCASPDAGGSFTSLLFLPHDQAVDLLHFGPDSAAAAAAAVFGVGSEPRVSISLKEDSPEAPIREPRLKEETPESEDLPSIVQRPAKRKEGDKSKEMAPNTKRKKSTEGGSAGGEKLPYVHVRARRGQATDSHSLAERARREKINARMKVLRELVPGCSKISGTTSLLDEIINHVQSLQRMIELLSMRLAAVNPRISFTGYDYFSSVDTSDGERRPTLQHIWHIDSGNPQQVSSVSEKEDTYSHSLITHGNSLFQFHQFTSVKQHTDHRKTQL